MYIRWKYNDHGHPDFKELEIPDDFDGYQSVEEWICENDLVPTWSERFMVERIKWEKLKLSAEEIKARRVAKLKASIIYHTHALDFDKKALELETNS